MNLDPIFIYYTLTKACNLTCLHCIRTNTTNKTSVNDEQSMRLNNALPVLESLSNFYPNSTLVLTGGEPTLYSGYEKVILKSIQLFKSVVLTSNGIFSEKTEKTLASFTKYPNFSIQISLDGDKTTHNYIRGKGSFEKTILRIKQLSDEGRKNSISISSTVNKFNKLSMFNLAEILNDINFYKWRISPEQIFIKEDLSRIISPIEWNSFVDEILKKCRFKVSIKKIFDFDLMNRALYIADYEKKQIRLNCGYGKYKLYIYPDFSVLPCTCISDNKIANLLSDTLEEINRKLQALQPHCESKSICYNCKYLPICNGGCVGYSYHYKGKIGLGDIRCPIINNLNKS